MATPDRDADLQGLFDAARVDTEPRAGHQQELRQQLLAALRAGRPVVQPPRRPLLRPVLKGALAAMLILGVLLAGWAIGFRGDQAKASFSEVLDEMRAHSSVSFSRDVFADGKAAHFEFLCDPAHFRYAVGSKVMIVDNAQRKSLALNLSSKKAIQGNLPVTGNPLHMILTLNSTAADFMGAAELDGQRVDFYQILLPDERISLWVDPGTDLPRRIESSDEHGVLKSSMYNFHWDCPIAPDTFALVPPPGFTSPVGEPSEAALLKALEICAKLNGNAFPPEFDRRRIDHLYAPLIRQDTTQPSAAGLSASRDGAAPAGSDIRAAYALARMGLAFAEKIQAQGHWEYRGDGVALGDARRIVCWWQLPGAPSPRAIFGNLRIADVSLAQIEAGTTR